MNIVGAPVLPVAKYKKRANTEYIVVHCAQTDAKWNGTIADVRDWHTDAPPDGNGWMDVGYHYFIRRNGTIERGRPWWSVGSGVKDWNHNSLHICMAGGCDKDGKEENNFTPEQWTALKELLQYWKEQPSCAGAEIRGHRDFPGVTKYCPSFDVKEWLKENPL